MTISPFTRRLRLFLGLVHGRVAQLDPLFLDIDITNRCNLQCVGCLYHSPLVSHLKLKKGERQDIEPELIEKLCAELDPGSTANLILQGAGEPLLHPKIDKIISMIKSKGFRVILMTNGTLLDPAMTKRLADSGLDILKVSLWAASPEQYRINYPGSDPDHFFRVREALLGLKSMKVEGIVRNPSLHIYFMVNKTNLHEPEVMIRLAAELGCENLTFAPMVDINDELLELRLTQDEANRFARSLIGIQKRMKHLGISSDVKQTLLRLKYREELWKYFPCTIAWFHARIRVDGTVQSCGRCDSKVSFGSLYEKSFREIWNSRAAQDFRHQMLWQKNDDRLKLHCNCTSCCFVRDMKRIDDIFKWIRPILGPFRKKCS